MFLGFFGAKLYGFDLNFSKLVPPIIFSLVVFYFYSTKLFPKVSVPLEMITIFFCLYVLLKTCPPAIVLFLATYIPLKLFYKKINLMGRKTGFFAVASLLTGLLIPVLISFFLGPPILRWELRMSLATSPIRPLCFGLIAVALFRYAATTRLGALIAASIAGILSTSLLGFRLEPLTIGLTLIIFIYLTGKSFRIIFPMLLVLIPVLVFVGYAVLESSPQEWRLSPLELPIYRAGYTLWIFSQVVEKAWPLGVTLGRATFQLPKAREVVSAEVLGQPGVSTTSTIFGPQFLDFGFPGVFILFSALGILASTTYRNVKSFGGAYIYSMFLSVLVSGIETGLEVVMLTTLLILAYVSHRLGSAEQGKCLGLHEGCLQ